MSQLVLVGFMGSGKTTVGRLLAECVHSPHLDLDEMIVTQTGKPISRIFTEQGEAYFRELESKTLKLALGQEGILSTGGGTPVSRSNRKLLVQSDIPVIFLKASPQIILDRLKNDQTRPLLQTLNEDRFLELFRKRANDYDRVSDIEILTDQKTPQDIVREIIEALTLHVK